MRSEVARLKQQLLEEYLAGKNGLTGLAYGTSQHSFITQRMENMHVCQKQIIALVGDAQAKQIIIDTFAACEGEPSR